MQSHSAPTAPPLVSDAPTLTDGAALWSQLCAAMDQLAQAQVRVVALAGRVQRSGTIETFEGVSLDTALTLTHRLPQADRGMLLTAADVLRDMPETRALFESGMVSWGQVRGIVAEVRRLPRALRGIVDARIGMSADLLPKMDPDDLLDQVRVAVQELRDTRVVERSEQATERGSFLWGQPAMFGPAKVYGELDNVSFGQLFDRVDAFTPADDGRSLSQRRAHGLIALATHECATAEAGEAGGRAGRPGQVSVIVDVRDATPNAAGVVDLPTNGCLPTLTARAVEALAADADVQVVLVDGARPLTVTRKVRAKAMPTEVRRAVMLRDGGDRFPGSRRRVEHVHHLDRRRHGHHVDQLAGLSDITHRRVHRQGWKITIDPDTAELTFSRGERTWNTLPRRTRLRRTPPPTRRSGDDAP